jgi:dolichyl-phosphate beta-glucosyltransferase
MRDSSPGSKSPSENDGAIWLSLVVPAFDEAERLAEPLRAMSDYLQQQPYSSEIVIVDDGSTDATFETACATAAELPTPVRVLRYRRNAGKGHALKLGFAAARGQRILFTDADLSTPIHETERLLESLERGCDFAIGSRKMPGSEIRVRQPLYREWMGKVFTQLVRLSIADVSDATCGFKAFRGDVGRDLFSRLRIYDWSFDAELFWIAERRGYRHAELAVRWTDQAGTSVKLWRDVVTTLIGLVRIRLYALRGVYDRPHEVDAELEVWPRTEVTEGG